MMIGTAIAVTAMSPATGAGRPLPVPASSGWQHADTGVILMPKLGEFQRTSLQDNSTAELDVSATFRTPDAANEATVYIFRPGIFSLPIWFDRAHTAMAHNANFTLGSQAAPVARFASRGSANPNGLRVVHAIAGKPGATALAMAALGEWLVAIRLTSTSKSPAEADSMLTDLVSKIGWPKGEAKAPALDLVTPCASPLKYKRAKALKPDLSQSLFGSVLNAMASNVKAAPPSRYCREGVGTADFAVYRPVGSNDFYLMAFGDAGISASISPQISMTGRKGEYSVVLTDLDSSDVYPGFNALPEPAQVKAMVTQMRPMSSTAKGTKNISVSLPDK